MSDIWILACPKGAPLMTADHLIDAAREEFGPALRVELSRAGEADYLLYLRTRSGPEFAIAHYADNLMIGLEGTLGQNAQAAAWIRGLLPERAPRIIAGDEAWRGHAELTHGITAERVLAEWVDHSVPGWNARDPDLW